MPTCVKCQVLTSTSKRCPSCQTCYCSKACRSTDWHRHKSECTRGESVSSGYISSNVAPFTTSSGKGCERTLFCVENQYMYPNKPREHYLSFTKLQLWTHSQLKFLNILDQSLYYLCRRLLFGFKRFGIISYDPFDQLNPTCV
jgi:hypothetical protein